MVTHDIAKLRKIAANTTLSVAERASAHEIVSAFEYTMSVYSPPTVCHRGEQLLDEMRRDMGALPRRRE